jgi:mono/diheme cytochrome c family protein
MFTKLFQPAYRLALFISLTFILQAAVCAQETQPAPKTGSSAFTAIPADAAKQANPVKSSPESITRAKKWWALDCAMCHGASGDGKGTLATDMKLKIADFTDPSTLKDRTDGEIYYIIKKGHQDMPPEGDRIKTEEGWDLVNYVRSFSKTK